MTIEEIQAEYQDLAAELQKMEGVERQVHEQAAELRGAMKYLDARFRRLQETGSGGQDEPTPDGQTDGDVPPLALVTDAD